MSLFDPAYIPDPDLEKLIAEEERERSRYATSVEWARIMAARPAPDENEERHLERFYVGARRCEVCAGLMVVSTKARHHTCAPTCERCYRPVTNCQCRRAAP